MEFTPEFIQNINKVNKSVDTKYGKKKAANITEGFSDAYAGTASPIDSYYTEEQMQAMGPATAKKTTYVEGKDPYQYNPNNSNGKLPSALEAILAETAKKTGNTLNQGTLSSVASQMNVAPVQKKPIVEVQQPTITPTPTMVSNNSGIDYTILKAIIKECIDEKFKEMNKTSLNESTLKTIQLKAGKINLLDNSGNIFTAKLEKTGNINDRKK